MPKLVRFLGPRGGDPRYGRVGDDGAVEALDAPVWLGGRATGERHALTAVRLLAPCEPTKVVCVARNYRAHADELGNETPAEPLVFIKPPSAVIGPGAAIVRPRGVGVVHHEAELGVVIGRRCRRVTAAYARSFGTGMVCVNDVTAREVQKREGHFTRAKGYDTFCPIGPWIEEGPVDTANVNIRCRVSGQLRQAGHSRDMLTEVWELVAFISTIMTLEPGDVVATGTPAGVGPLVSGDVVEVEIDGVGTLTNTVVDQA
jgi:2-keto-4-pentenoate hydratase/2-oxohepta-3-ene-1,7-dioic acid hydratase in catechol pathway